MNSGSNQTFTVTANSGYHIADVVVDGTHLLAQASPFTYTFSNVKAAHTIAASFGRQVNVNTLAGLCNAFNNQQTGDEIIIATGTYQLAGNTELAINVNNMYIHSASGNRDDVYIRGDALSSGATVKVIFNFTQGVYGQYTTLSNMKIGTVGWSAIQMNGDQAASYSLFNNLHIVDCYEQFVKGAENITGITGLTIQNCLMEFSAANHLAAEYYTCGIDIHQAVNCIIQDNTIKYMQSPDGTNTAEPAIHLWSDITGGLAENNIVQRNSIIDCDRGIAFWQNSGGIIRNNMIYQGGNTQPVPSGTTLRTDAQIYIEHSPDTQIYNNTVYSLASYPNTFEYRYSDTANVLIENNLTNLAITARDSATGTIGQYYQRQERVVCEHNGLGAQSSSGFGGIGSR